MRKIGINSAAHRRRGRFVRTVGGACVVIAFMFIGPQAAHAAQAYTITADGIALRSGPGSSYSLLGRLNTGAAIQIDCQVQGGTNVGGNATWDRLTGGQWVADYYTSTPSFNSYAPGLGDCNTPGVSQQMRNAANWAINEKNSPDPTWSDHYGHAWSGWCEQFAEQAEGFTQPFTTAYARYQWHAARGRIHTDTNPPAGAVVFYGGSNGAGHVAISIGGGQEIGTYGYVGDRLPVRQYPVIGFLSNSYLGWANPIGS
jgi:uncharacterized protein YraI